MEIIDMITKRKLKKMMSVLFIRIYFTGNCELCCTRKRI